MNNTDNVSDKVYSYYHSTSRFVVPFSIVREEDIPSFSRNTIDSFVDEIKSVEYKSMKVWEEDLVPPEKRNSYDTRFLLKSAQDTLYSTEYPQKFRYFKVRDVIKDKLIQSKDFCITTVRKSKTIYHINYPAGRYKFDIELIVCYSGIGFFVMSLQTKSSKNHRKPIDQVLNLNYYLPKTDEQSYFLDIYFIENIVDREILNKKVKAAFKNYKELSNNFYKEVSKDMFKAIKTVKPEEKKEKIRNLSGRLNRKYIKDSDKDKIYNILKSIEEEMFIEKEVLSLYDYKLNLRFDEKKKIIKRLGLRQLIDLTAVNPEITPEIDIRERNHLKSTADYIYSQIKYIPRIRESNENVEIEELAKDISEANIKEIALKSEDKGYVDDIKFKARVLLRNKAVKVKDKVITQVNIIKVYDAKADEVEKELEDELNSIFYAGKLVCQLPEIKHETIQNLSKIAIKDYKRCIMRIIYSREKSFKDSLVKLIDNLISDYGYNINNGFDKSKELFLDYLKHLVSEKTEIESSDYIDTINHEVLTNIILKNNLSYLTPENRLYYRPIVYSHLVYDPDENNMVPPANRIGGEFDPQHRFLRGFSANMDHNAVELEEAGLQMMQFDKGTIAGSQLDYTCFWVKGWNDYNRKNLHNKLQGVYFKIFIYTLAQFYTLMYLKDFHSGIKEEDYKEDIKIFLDRIQMYKKEFISPIVSLNTNLKTFYENLYNVYNIDKLADRINSNIEVDYNRIRTESEDNRQKQERTLTYIIAALTFIFTPLGIVAEIFDPVFNFLGNWNEPISWGIAISSFVIAIVFGIYFLINRKKE